VVTGLRPVQGSIGQDCVGTAVLGRAKLGSPRPEPSHKSETALPKLPDQRVTPSTKPSATIESVKAYRIQRIKSGMKFTCTHCAHSVSTLDFDAKGGNLRTQAATAINLHATQAHREPMVVSPSDGQQRSWR
jgi:hypothetical protein